MSHVPIRLLFQKHRELRAAGVESYELRQRMITLAYLREHHFDAWVRMRRALSVFDVIEADGERMKESLTKGRGGFRRDEIKLVRPRQTNERRAV